jgi:glycosyltransferase involved in cell wall biosynthesis
MQDEIKKYSKKTKTISKKTRTLIKANQTKQQLEQVKYKYLTNIQNVIEEYNHNGKKTIAFFCDTFYPFVDGVTNVVDNYAKRLKENFNVIVCVPRHKNEYVERDYPILYFKSVYFEMVNYGIGQPSTDREFLKLFKQLHIDLIHIHSPFMVGHFALKEARKRDIPVIATFHSQFKQDFKKIVKTESLTKMLLSYIMEVFNGVDEVWTMNQATKKTLDSYKFKGKAKIISNATDFEMPKDKQAFEQLAIDKFGVVPGENLYCFVGRLIEQKNIVLVAQSLAELKKKGIPFKMIYIGDGPDRKMLEDAIESLGIGNQVILAGKVMDKQLIGSVLYHSKVMLFPSVYDTDGIVKYEAAAFSTPTLLLKGSNASYNIEDGETGFICEGTPEAIAKRLEELYHNPQEVERVGNNANKKIFFRWDDVVAQASGMYNQLIEMSEKQILTPKQIKRTEKKQLKKELVVEKIKRKILNDLEE